MIDNQKYKYFNILISINKEKYKNGGINNIRLSSKDIRIIDEWLADLYNSPCKGTNETLRKVLHTCASIWAYQPFYDGNSRTIKAFLVKYLKEKNIDVLITHDDFIIPIFYPDEDNKILKKDISNLKKKIM